MHKVTRGTEAWGLQLQARQAREGATQCLFRPVLASPPRSAPHVWVAAGLAGVRALATPSGLLGSGTRPPACQTQLILLLMAAGVVWRETPSRVRQLGWRACAVQSLGHVRLSDPVVCSLPGSPVCGISQERYCSGLPFPPPREISQTERQIRESLLFPYYNNNPYYSSRIFPGKSHGQKSLVS